MRFNAEQPTTMPRPSLPASASAAPMAASHGQRSSSLSGVPADILATLAAGWHSAASRKPTPRLGARAVVGKMGSLASGSEDRRDAAYLSDGSAGERDDHKRFTHRACNTPSAPSCGMPTPSW